MPFKPKHRCNKVGCNVLTSERYCPEHQREADAAYEASRGNAAARGYDSRWAKVRQMRLVKSPLCQRCAKQGKVVPASLVHHKDRNPRNNHEDNHESLCEACHEEEHRGERWAAKR